RGPPCPVSASRAPRLRARCCGTSLPLHYRHRLPALHNLPLQKGGAAPFARRDRPRRPEFDPQTWVLSAGEISAERLENWTDADSLRRAAYRLLWLLCAEHEEL